MDSVKQSRKRIYEVSFGNETERAAYLEEHSQAIGEGDKVTITISGNADRFIKDLSRYTIRDINMRTLSLEELFLQYYREEE